MDETISGIILIKINNMIELTLLIISFCILTYFLSILCKDKKIEKKYPN